MPERRKKKKDRRRRPGEGSVYRRKDGRYVAEITLLDGSRKQYYYKREEDAIAKKNQVVYELQQGILATGPRQTVKHFLENWLENMHGPHLRATSYYVYKQLLTHHVFPAIGSIQLQKLSSQDIQKLYTNKMKEEYAANTIWTIHRMLHRALNDAVEWRLISSNVCGKGKVKLPRRRKRDIQILTKEQAQKLLTAAKGHWYLEAALTLAVATGMRRGELLALRWKDIDFQERCLYVRHTLTRVGSQGIIESEPKTESSKRVIMLPQFVIEALYEQLERQKELQTQQGWQEHDLVFSSEHGGYLEPFRFHRHFKKLLILAGLPEMRIHDLRHSAATILLSMGVHPKLVQELLGHSNMSMTMDVYSHVLPSMQREMMDDLNDFFQSS